jgi:hypothetical protein
MVNHDLSLLTPDFQKKVKVFMQIVKKKYPNLFPFETYRTPERQRWLFNNKKTFTLNSNHTK